MVTVKDVVSGTIALAVAGTLAIGVSGYTGSAGASPKEPTFGTIPANGSRRDFPDYVSVIDDSGEIVGYVDKRFLLNAPEPASPSAATSPSTTVLFPVVNTEMRVVAYLGPRGLLSIEAAKDSTVAQIDDYTLEGTPAEH